MGLVFSNDKIIYSFEPPRKINKFLYRCDKYFHLDTILPLYKEIKNNHGCIIVCGEEAKFYKLSLREEEYLGCLNVKLARDHSKGGQSSNRFARLHDQDIDAYINKIYDKCLKYYSSDGNASIESLTIIGSGNKKKLLASKLKSSCLSNLSNKIITSNGEVGLSLKLCREQIYNINRGKEKEVKEEFEEKLRVNPDILCFGDENKINLENGMIQKLYVHKDYQEIYKDSFVECVEVYDDWILSYGNIIGVKWY